MKIIIKEEKEAESDIANGFEWIVEDENANEVDYKILETIK